MAEKSKFSTWFKNSITARMLVTGFLLLVLLIPLSFVQSLITERKFRQQEVIQEVNNKWGNNIIFSGPILKIPYKTYSEERSFNQERKKYETKIQTTLHYAYLFPDELDIQSNVETKKLKRGIYQSIVYTTQVNIKGMFPKIDLSENDILQKDIVWDKIQLIIQTTNLKGIKETVSVQLNNTPHTLVPKYNTTQLKDLQSKAITGLEVVSSQPLSFQAKIVVNGSESLQFIPIGKITTATMKSKWHSPGFTGEFLPDDKTKETSSEGFYASWKILETNRRFEQLFFDQIPDLRQYAFGTNLVNPVNDYQKTERTAKYGFMVIGLTFLVFLLIQIVSKIYIHPFQYVMIGLALVMFYTLLISISEHSSFLKAYGVASISVLGLLILYTKTIFKSFKFPLFIGGSLAMLYGFIYVIIQLENYALLVGSIGLFIILSIIMYVSRKIDWGNQE